MSVSTEMTINSLSSSSRKHKSAVGLGYAFAEGQERDAKINEDKCGNRKHEIKCCLMTSEKVPCV